MCLDPKKRNAMLKKQLAKKQLERDNLILSNEIRKCNNSIRYFKSAKNKKSKKKK